MQLPSNDERIPVHLLTGFLGSGKTSLLRHILADPAYGDSAVIINEFGEAGLDHLLVREVAEDIALLASGCVCCTVREDLVSVLKDLQTLAAAGEIPHLTRVVIETTGLADPAPILRTIMGEAELVDAFRTGSVVTTVDAINGASTLDRFPEAAGQVALADRLVLTKLDLADGKDAIEKRIGAINAAAPILHSTPDAMPPPNLLFGELGPRLEMPAASHGHSHAEGIETFTVELERSVDWPAFVDWLQLLLVNRGDTIMRIKGILDVAGEPRPVVVNGVQHLVHAPRYLDAWPGGATRPWLVFIARHLSRGAIERSLRSTYA